jgi:hypothetical protein
MQITDPFGGKLSGTDPSGQRLEHHRGFTVVDVIQLAGLQRSNFKIFWMRNTA